MDAAPPADRERTGPAWGTFLEPESGAEGPLHARLARALRTAVTSGRLAAGSTLPASRVLAADLRCSRWVVTEAYAQLVAEGYFEARIGRLQAGAGHGGPGARLGGDQHLVAQGPAPGGQPPAEGGLALVPGPAGRQNA
ncbi:GntR family transcriptional regulator [Streptomyces cyaneofuscatus]|uniref:GntR family transcriptional regulator n=1 Tax=Streptomyces cyaneofuscatus TaxID=66883 RepID=UPI00365F22B4